MSSRVAASGLLAALALACTNAIAAPIVLSDFNLVVGGNLTSNSEVEGRTLVGGTLSGPASNYAVALTPSSNFSTVDTLIVRGNIVATNVNVAAGDVRTGGTASGAVNLNGVGSNLFQNDPNVAGSVASAILQINQISSYLSSLTTNSSVINPAGPSAATFEAVAGLDGTAVFSINGSIFTDPDSQQYDLNLGAGVTSVVINVSGSSVLFNQGNFVNNFTNQSVRPSLIWNFSDAQSITLDRNFFGSLVAPNANLSNSTAIEGSVFLGGNFDQRGEVHLPLYRGSVPEVPEPSTWLMISSALLGFGARRLFRSRKRN